MKGTLDNHFKDNIWFDLLPDKKTDICEENLYNFFEYVFERQEIWYRRNILKDPKPWTENEILRDYKFTNVYRELDRTTQYLINTVTKKEVDPKELIWKIILFRYFNTPELFKEIGIPSYKEYEVKKFTKLVDDYKSSGKNPFTTAYMINATLAKGQKRHMWYLNDAIPHMHNKVGEILDALQEADNKKKPMILINKLTELKAVSTFLAHEFYQDFCDCTTYGTKLMNLNKNDYTNVGPGCSLGLRLIFPSSQTIKDQEEKIRFLQEISSEYLKQFGNFKYLVYNREKDSYSVSNDGELDLHNLEFSLCEFQKLWKMGIKQGKQRSKYK